MSNCKGNPGHTGEFLKLRGMLLSLFPLQPRQVHERLPSDALLEIIQVLSCEMWLRPFFSKTFSTCLCRRNYNWEICSCHLVAQWNSTKLGRALIHRVSLLIKPVRNTQLRICCNGDILSSFSGSSFYVGLMHCCCIWLDHAYVNVPHRLCVSISCFK